MPGPGTPFDSFIPPYDSIRVDAFSSTPTHPALFLLSHTHSDHITGLDAKSFSSTIICSPDAKEMLLRYEVYGERHLLDNELRAEHQRVFSHLRVQGGRDLLRTIELNTPTTIELYDGEEVTITLIDANHCPGAVMFLIEGIHGAVIHTGDLRAEPSFLRKISRNPFLAPYMRSQTTAPRKRLNTIFLDTACLLLDNNVPPKQDATAGLIELLRLFPPDALFFINAWTWGYEDILIAIAKAFNTKIHVDRYKHSVLSNLADPRLNLSSGIFTRDHTDSRFHACERFDRCESVSTEQSEARGERGFKCLNKDGKLVVYINPVTMVEEKWEKYHRETKGKLIRKETIMHLMVPLSRHSPLPELQAFVKLFRPQRVVPNTIDKRLRGLDWACMRRMFGDCLSATATFSSSSQYPSVEEDIKWINLGFNSGLDEGGDTALKNLEGDEETSHALAATWADDGKIRKETLEKMLKWLDGTARLEVQKLLGIKSAKTKKSRQFDSDEDTDDDDDERGRTAHLLFGSPAQDENEWPSSPPQQASNSDHADKLPTPDSSPMQRSRQLPEPLAHEHMPPSAIAETSTKAQTRLASPARISPNPIPLQRKAEAQDKINTSSLPSWIIPKSSKSDDRQPAMPMPSTSYIMSSPETDITMTISDRERKRKTPPGTPDRPHTPLLPPVSFSPSPPRAPLKFDRLEIAHRLATARPDLVVPSYPSKRARQLSWREKDKTRADYNAVMATLPADPDSLEQDGEGEEEKDMDWSRSEELVQKVTEQIARGGSVRDVLPTLACAESQ